MRCEIFGLKLTDPVKLSIVILPVNYVTLVQLNLKYIIKRRISTGSFGTIYELLSEDDNKVYALKELTN